MTAARATSLRPAVEGDLEAVLEIERAAFVRAWSADSFRRELARDDRVWLVAVADGRVVGYAGAADLAGDAHVLTVAVAAGHRRRGHGAALVAGLLAAVADRFGARRATLEVRESNTGARALYRRHGFREVGVRPGYYQDDGEGAVVLWCDDVAAALAEPAPRPTSTPAPEDTP